MRALFNYQEFQAPLEKARVQNNRLSEPLTSYEPPWTTIQLHQTFKLEDKPCRPMRHGHPPTPSPPKLRRHPDARPSPTGSPGCLLRGRSQADSLNVVPSRVNHKRGVVMGAVLRPRARRAVVLGPGLDGRLVERVDSGAVLPRTRQPHANPTQVT